MTVFFSTVTGYFICAMKSDRMSNRSFYIILLAVSATASLIYVALDGYNGFNYPCRRKRSLTGKPQLKLLESSTVDDIKPKNESLFEQGDLDIQKEQYINCMIFYGKYFTGDCFIATTPFVY